jgi:hypothetical protein
MCNPIWDIRRMGRGSDSQVPAGTLALNMIPFSCHLLKLSVYNTEATERLFSDAQNFWMCNNRSLCESYYQVQKRRFEVIVRYKRKESTLISRETEAYFYPLISLPIIKRI